MTRFVADVNKDAVFPRANTKSFANGWSNPYRYDGRDGVRYDLETGLYRMSVRAYDPALGRFLSRDPLNRAPLFFDDQPYVYAGDNPLINVDPSGESLIPAGGSGGSAPRPVSEPKCRLTAKPGTGKPWRPKESVRLGSRTWTLDDALRDRPGFQLAFFKVYASGWPSSWGQAEVDFTRYLVQSGRIRRSPYWSSADGGLVTDVFQAAYIHQHGGKERRGVVLEWLRFISAPNANTFWRAHNDSILLHTFDGVGQAERASGYAWSPSGRWIAVRNSDYQSGDNIYLVAPDDPARTVDVVLAEKAGQQMTDPIWSSDGKTLIVFGVGDQQPYTIDIASYLASYLASKGLQP
jgi:RHS repeat-associated protein